MHLKMLSVKWHPFCIGLNVITLNMLNLLETYLHFPSILNNVMEQVFKILLVEDKVLLSLHNYTKAADDYARFTRNSRGTWDWLMSAKLMVNRELVGKIVCSSYVTHQKIISCCWILALAITRAYSPCTENDKLHDRF